VPHVLAVGLDRRVEALGWDDRYRGRNEARIAVIGTAVETEGEDAGLEAGMERAGSGGLSCRPQLARYSASATTARRRFRIAGAVCHAIERIRLGCGTGW
jgi:hypothetical protein